MDEIIGRNSELDSLCNNFFDEFAESVEKNDRSKSFGVVVRLLVQFGYDDSRRNLEIIGLIP